MKNSKWKTLVAGTLAGVLAFALVATASAAVGSALLNANYNDIKITLDGTRITPVDANGNAVEPFAVNGTTYLPVRAVGQALGLEVGWDQATTTVSLTSAKASEQGLDPRIAGRWQMNVDFADMFEEELDNMGMDAMRLSSFVITMNFDFKSDGTYTCELDTDAFQTTMDTMKSEMRDGFTKYIEDMIAAQGADMTIDEFFELSGTTLDEALDEAFSAEDVASTADELAGEGNYETKDGKLYLSDGLDYHVDPQVYYTYAIDEDSLYLLRGVGTDEDEFAEFFPIRLVRLGQDSPAKPGRKPIKTR